MLFAGYSIPEASRANRDGRNGDSILREASRANRDGRNGDSILRVGGLLGTYHFTDVYTW